MAISKEVYDLLNKKGEEYGIPAEIWYPIVMTESGGDPLAVGDSGKSHGLFQIYTVAHPDYNVSRGKNSVEYQIDYWLPELANTYKKGQSLGLSGVDLALYTEKYGERPKWTKTVENNIKYYYNEFLNSFDDSKLQYMTLGLNSNDTNSLFDLSGVKNVLLEGAVIYMIGMVIVLGLVLVFFPDITGIVKTALSPSKVVSKVGKLASEGGK